MMKLSNLFTLAAASASLITLFSAGNAHAQADFPSLINIDAFKSTDPDAIPACPLFLCSPEEEITLNTQDLLPTSFINNTDFAVTGFEWQILPGSNAIFEVETFLSDSFSDFEVSDDGKSAQASGGLFPIGSTLLLSLEESPALTEGVDYTIRFTGFRPDEKSVPEPATVLGLLIAAGSGIALKRRSAAA